MSQEKPGLLSLLASRKEGYSSGKAWFPQSGQRAVELLLRGRKQGQADLWLEARAVTTVSLVDILPASLLVLLPSLWVQRAVL